MEYLLKLPAIWLSALLHFGFSAALLVFVVVEFSSTVDIPEVLPFDMVEAPKDVQPKKLITPVKPQKPKPEIPPVKESNKIFGRHRKSITTDQATAPAVKLGNTLAKEVDQKKLDNDSPDSLPIPTAEYLVSEMPTLLSSFKPIYTKAAKAAGIQGVVLLAVLIDKFGKVRSAFVIQGLGYGLDEEAMRAIYKHQFSPAQVSGTATAVKIRYKMRFILE